MREGRREGNREGMVLFRCREEEKEALKQEAVKNGQKLSAYLRERLLTEPEKALENRQRRETKEALQALLYQVRKIGLNINQIAKANNAGFHNPEDSKVLTNYLDTMEKQIQAACKEVERTYGDHKA